MATWIQATNDVENLPKNEDSIPLLIDGKYDLGYHSEPRKLFVTHNHGDKPYRLVKWLSESTPTVSGHVKEVAQNYARGHIVQSWQYPKEEAAKKHFDYLVESIAAHFLAGHAYKGQQVEDEIKKKAQEELLWALIKENQDADDGPFTKEDVESDYYSWFEKLKIITPQPAIPLSVIDELEKANPYDNLTGNYERYKFHGWCECVSKLRELLQSQPVPESVIITTPQAISDVWDAAAEHEWVIFQPQDEEKDRQIPDKAIYLKQKFNIILSTQTDKEVKP